LSKLKQDGSNDGDEIDDKLLLEDNFAIRAPLFSTIKEDMRMELSEEEADYLRDQFKDVTSSLKQNHNLLSQLFTVKRTEVVANSNNFQEMANQLIADD